MSATMQAAYLTGVRQIEIRDVPRPVLRGREDVLVRVGVVGICGSDVHNYTQGGTGDTAVRFPFILGHEGAGTVAAVGAGVKGLRVGQRIAIEPALPCWTCDQCRMGRWNTCRRILFLSAAGQEQGLLREYIVLPAKSCIPLPTRLALEEAAFGEPLSIALYAARQALPLKGATVAVLGAGPIGLGIMLCARTLGAARVFVTEPIPHRLKLARRLGADWAGAPATQDVVKAVQRRAPLGVDVVFECCGKEEALEQGARMLKPGARLVLVGIPEEPITRLNIHEMRRRELTLVNIRRQCDCLEPALELIRRRRVAVAPLITHRFPLGEAGRAFELVARYGDGVVKAMLTLDA